MKTKEEEIFSILETEIETELGRLDMWKWIKALNPFAVQLRNTEARLEFARVLLAQAEIELADKAFYVREFAAVSAERDALREQASVPQPSSNTGQLPPADQVEALARVLREASTGNKNNQPAAGIWIKEARAAIAHLNTRPEGLPTAEQLKAAHMQYAQDYEAGKNDGSLCASDFALDYLRPWLRDPVGFELDVHPDQLELYKWVTEPDGGYEYAAQQAIDLCRSRIRPVFECKECAKLRDEVTFWKRENVASNNKMLAARAALDGE
jgi:hypothetical protein